MRLCPLCGELTRVDEGVCPHHFAIDQEWAVRNRVFCDFLHRRVQPQAVLLTIDVDEALELTADN